MQAPARSLRHGREGDRPPGKRRLVLLPFVLPSVPFPKVSEGATEDAANVRVLPCRRYTSTFPLNICEDLVTNTFLVFVQDPCKAGSRSVLCSVRKMISLFRSSAWSARNFSSPAAACVPPSVICSAAIAWRIFDRYFIKLSFQATKVRHAMSVFGCRVIARAIPNAMVFGFPQFLRSHRSPLACADRYWQGNLTVGVQRFVVRQSRKEGNVVVCVLRDE